MVVANQALHEDTKVRGPGVEARLHDLCTLACTLYCMIIIGTARLSIDQLASKKIIPSSAFLAAGLKSDNLGQKEASTCSIGS